MVLENVVKYIKGNFLENRIYIDDSTLNHSAIEWLERTANAKIHGTTKLIPSEVMKEERKYLRGFVVETPKKSNIFRTVRKDNTICYESNRYSVPLGTYNEYKVILITINEDMLKIETQMHENICEHKISLGRGRLIQNTDHKRDRASTLDKIQNTLDERLNSKNTGFLQKIRIEKSRYARDQFKLINTLCDKYDKADILKGIEFCDKSKLIGATYLKDYLEHTAKVVKPTALVTIPLSDNKYHVTTQKRSIDEYSKVGGTL